MVNTDSPYEQTDRWIGSILAAGLVLAIVVMILGLILTALQGGYKDTVLPLDRVGPALVNGKAPAVLDIGILILFATPLAGVLAALAGFVSRRNTVFVGITVALLVLLVIGFAVALR